MYIKYKNQVNKEYILFFVQNIIMHNQLLFCHYLRIDLCYLLKFTSELKQCTKSLKYKSDSNEININ